MAGADFDVDSLRHAHESDAEWKLRRAFIVAHKDSFTKKRLLCLASCFINVECYGCTYPRGVMEELYQLKAAIQGVIDQHEAVKQVTTKARSSIKPVKFVKASEPPDTGGGQEANSKDRCYTGFVKGNTLGKVDSSPNDETKVQHGVSGNPAESSKLYESTDVAHGTGTASSSASGTTGSARPYPQTGAGIKSLKGKHFKNALNNFSAHIANEQRSELDNIFYRLSANLSEIVLDCKNPISALHMAADKSRVTVTSTFKLETNNQFACHIEINYVFISKGIALNKKMAKQKAYETAVENLRKPFLKVVSKDLNCQELQCSAVPPSGGTPSSRTFPSDGHMHSVNVNVTKHGQRMQSNTGSAGTSRKRHHPATNTSPISDFLIIERQVPSEMTNPVSILNQSADFNKMKLTYDFRDEMEMGRSRVACHLLLNDAIPFVMAFGENRMHAKSAVAANALEELRKTCWTIRTKKNEDSEESSITRDEILGDIEKKKECIPDSNVGNKLLRLMGWSGGGVGKSGQGIAEPVTMDSVVNREGLGLQAEQGIGLNFVHMIRKTIQEYAKSGKQTDLSFSPEFTKDERAIIHKEAQKLGLRTRSYGKEENRYLVVCRKRNRSELFDHVMSSGGETDKYILLPPGSL